MYGIFLSCDEYSEGDTRSSTLVIFGSWRSLLLWMHAIQYVNGAIAEGDAYLSRTID